MKTPLPATRGALLTVVPHDTLTNVSFAALQDPRGRYLLEDYTLHYAPAGALLQFTAAQGRSQPRTGAMLMVSDPDPARRSTLDPMLPRLPGARNEAVAITRQLDASRVLSLTFARAFLYAGAASMIASVWEVADEPSNRLLPAFYRAWLGGASKAAALRQAQLRLLADLRSGRVRVTTAIGPVPVSEHPVFWAGFALFGEPD